MLKSRQSIRLPNYDYSRPGYYFVTICTKNKVNYFGEINKEKIMLSDIGKITNQYWQEIPDHFLNVRLDKYIIMPNHVHGIIIITEKDDSVGVQNFEPLQNGVLLKSNKFQHIIPKSLGSIIRGLKSSVTRWCHENKKRFCWQRNFYDHVIRNEESLFNIRSYIDYNYLKWHYDIENRNIFKKLSKEVKKKYYKNLYK